MDEIADARRLEAARTQSLYRDLNERIEDINEGFGAVLSGGEWMCECAEETCAAPMQLTLAEYEAVRAYPARFAVLPGHMLPGVEKVVIEYERYVVVEGLGVAADYAAAHDLRSRTKPARPVSSERAVSASSKKARSHMTEERTSSRETFRENEVLRTTTEGLPGPFRFRCECARDCAELMMVDALDVSAVRENPKRLVITPGHLTDEAIVLGREGYLIVEMLL
jgi:hypothetical protein